MIAKFIQTVPSVSETERTRRGYQDKLVWNFTSNLVECVGCALGRLSYTLKPYVHVNTAIPCGGDLRDALYQLKCSRNMRYIHTQIVGVFKELQTELFKKGYYLLDETEEYEEDDENQTCSYNGSINVYLGKPSHYDTAKALWHGLNKLP